MSGMMNGIHFDSSISTTADDFVGDEIYTVHLICVSRKIRFDFVCLQVPDLSGEVIFRMLKKKEGNFSQEKRITSGGKLTFNVLSLLALTSILESALQASR